MPSASVSEHKLIGCSGNNCFQQRDIRGKKTPKPHKLPIHEKNTPKINNRKPENHHNNVFTLFVTLDKLCAQSKITAQGIHANVAPCEMKEDLIQKSEFLG